MARLQIISFTERGKDAPRGLERPPGVQDGPVVDEEDVAVLPRDGGALLLQDPAALGDHVGGQGRAVAEGHGLHGVVPGVLPPGVGGHHAVEPDLPAPALVPLHRRYRAHYGFDAVVGPFQLHAKLGSPVKNGWVKFPAKSSSSTEIQFQLVQRKSTRKISVWTEEMAFFFLQMLNVANS
jgi:hypothetical protein